MRKHLYRLCFVLIGILIASLALPSRAFAQSGDLTPNPVAEQWVLEQVISGRTADLNQPQFPNEEDRVLSADFLVKLLEKPDIAITRYGIEIRNAVFAGPLDLDYITVDYPLWLEDCQFSDQLSLYESHFARDLYFRGSKFLSAVNLGFSKIDGNLVADEAKFLDSEQEANFNSIKVEGLVSLEKAEFAGRVDFIGAQIGSDFDATDARFNNKERSASFGSMNVEDHVSLTKARFFGGVNFVAAEIGGIFNADEAQFHSADQPVNFERMKTGSLLSLAGAKFWGSVTFNNAQVGSSLIASDARFYNREASASFNSVQVTDLVSLNKAEFSGPVDFIAARVDGSFDARESSFKNKENPAVFNSMIVGGSVFLQNVEFAGAVDFGYAQISSSFEANQAHFQSKKNTASFNSMKVTGPVFLTEAEFAGPVDFSHANIGSNLEANDSGFHNEEQTVLFESVQVGRNMFLDRATFAGPVIFSFLEVDNVFRADYSEFQNADNEPSFRNMIVRQEASFVGTKFNQGVDFDNAVFLDLTIRAAEPYHNKSGWGFQEPHCREWQAVMTEPKLHISNLRLNQTVVERKLDLTSLNIQTLTSRSLRVYGHTNITNVHFLNSADLENSQFGDLIVENVCWPPPLGRENISRGNENIKLGGMTYQNIHVILGKNQDDWNKLIGLMDQSSYNAQAYTILENHFVQQGYADRADEVYIAYKKREFRDGLSRFSMGWWSNLFLWSVGYGRKPGFVLIGALLFIIVGWLFVFRKPEGMVSLSKHEIIGPKVGNHGTLSRKIPMRVISSQHEIPYNPFWYSLDLFIPFIDLGFDDKWSPRPNRKWAIAYAKLHMLAGWVLLPIGLLAITGVIK